MSKKITLLDIVKNVETSKRNIGEVIYSSLPLQNNGLHLLDGEVISGNGAYKDFVDYVKSLYNTRPWLSWKQPKATANSTSIEGGTMVCSASSQYNSSYAPWKAMNGGTSSTDIWCSTANTTKGWWQVKFPYKLKITALTFISSYTSTYGAKNCRFYTSSSKTTPIGNAFVGPSGSFVRYTITNIPAEGIVTDTIYLDITSVYSTGCGIGGIEITAQRLGDAVNYFTTEQQWQSAVTNKGVCGKFVYNEDNNTVRLPKLTGIVEGTTDLDALGDLIEAGLPNITGAIRNINSNSSRSGATISEGSLYWGSPNEPCNAGGTATRYGYDILLNASKSNAIYGKSNTVQPQTIKILTYIVIANSDIPDCGVNLNNLADKDLSNITNIAKQNIADLCLPSNRTKSLECGANLTNYSAPDNGYVICQWWPVPSGCRFTLQNTDNLIGDIVHSSMSNEIIRLYIPVKKGQNYQVGYTGGTFSMHLFVYAEHTN